MFHAVKCKERAVKCIDHAMKSGMVKRSAETLSLSFCLVRRSGVFWEVYGWFGCGVGVGLCVVGVKSSPSWCDFLRI